uniref:Uncharacterized protein n=1 Tax=Lepeophtheirus salmonis TaxID=72036 RepID=A0A0K2VJ02_LEPSM
MKEHSTDSSSSMYV